MKLSKEQLKQIIKEELDNLMLEQNDYSQEIMKNLGVEPTPGDEYGRINFNSPEEAKKAKQKLIGLALNKLNKLQANDLITAKGHEEIKNVFQKGTLMPSDGDLTFAERDTVGLYVNQGNQEMSLKVSAAFKDLKSFLSAAARIERKMVSRAS